jgi:hypothetical protein
MRTLKALALSALLLIGSTTATFAAETSSVARSTNPATERFNDDGSGMARPTAPSTDRYNDDGSGMASPAVPSNDSEYERWV